MNEEFLIWLEENKDFALNVYENYYSEKADEEGEMMRGDDQYYGDDDCDMSNDEIYEDFAHCTGHSATYHGAYGVINDCGEGMDCDPDDEELQWEVLMILEKEPH